MESTPRKIERYIVEDYLIETKNYEYRTELINGEIVGLASPSLEHQDITIEMVSLFRQFIKKNGGKCRSYCAPTDVRLNFENMVVPDVFIACNPENFSPRYYDGAPDFVAEVVSTNKSDDYIRKLRLYQKFGVREYWIIDPDKEKVSVYFFEKSLEPEIYDFHTPIPVKIWEGKFSVTIAELY
ncbi:MAG: Uma2 family endonuclease [Oscillospiraceae bacterium]